MACLTLCCTCVDDGLRDAGVGGGCVEVEQKPLRLRDLVASLMQLQLGVCRGAYGVTNCLVLH